MLGIFKRKTTEERVADTALHRVVSVSLGGKQIDIPRPTLAVWIELSAIVSRLGEYPNDVSVFGIIASSDAEVYAEMLSVLACGVRKDNKREREKMAEFIKYHCSVEEVSLAITTTLNECNVGGFFALTTSLREVTITKPTREVVTTASGQL